MLDRQYPNNKYYRGLLTISHKPSWKELLYGKVVIIPCIFLTGANLGQKSVILRQKSANLCHHKDEYDYINL